MSPITMPEGGAGVKFSLIFFSSSEAPFSGDTYRFVIESARFADRHGFSSVWIPERHFTKDGWLYPNPAVLQAALARETSQIRLRAGSVVMPLHNPLRVAEEWAMVDNLSGGRVGVSFASGWHPNDFALFPENYAKRQEELYRGVQMVRQLWRGESVQVKGGDGKLVELKTFPPPIQSELPFWMTAAGNPKSFAGAGEIGANLLTHLFNHDITELAEKIQIYREALAKHGYDPQSREVSIMIHTFVGEYEDSAREQAQGPFCNYLRSASYLLNAIAFSRGQKVDISTLSEEDINDYLQFVFERLVSSQRVLFGSPASCLEVVRQLKAAGVDEIACQLDFGIEMETALASLTYLNQLKELSERELPDPAGPTAQAPHTLADTALHESASVQSDNSETDPGTRERDLDSIRRRCQEELSLPEFYRRLHERGIQLESAFQRIRCLWRGDGEALGDIQLPETMLREQGWYQIHPTLLDACFQVLIAALPARLFSDETLLYLPTGLRSFRLHKRPMGNVWSYVHLATPVEQVPAQLEGDVYVLDKHGELVVEVQGLKLQRSELPMQSAPNEMLKNWLYELHWEPTVLQETVSRFTETPGKWLLFMDQNGMGEYLAEVLAAQGNICFGVKAGDVFRTSAPGMYEVNPTRPDDIVSLLEEIRHSGTMHFQGIVHLWSLDMAPLDETNAVSFESDQAMGVGSALHIIQTLLRMPESESPPHIWFVTKGAQPVGDRHTALAVSQAPLWGLGKSCAMEHPELWGGLVDVDPDAPLDETAQQLSRALLRAHGEDLIAFRHGQSYVARLVRSHAWKPQKLELRSDVSYLITGGLWGMGFEVARWLVKKGARYIILLGRTALPTHAEWDTVPADSRLARQLAGIRELEHAGARVYYDSIDVADEQQLQTFLQELAIQNYPPIRGVMHAASVWRDADGQSLVRPLANLDMAALHAVFRPKVFGGWMLSKLLRDTPLDFFVSFSSGASMLGSAAQGNYAAAGEFLDVLAYYQRDRGQPAISIDWGAISEIGFGATEEGLRVHEYWEAHGIQRITPGQVLEALELLVPQVIARVGVMKLDWYSLRQFYPQITQVPLVKHLVAEVANGQTDAIPGLTETSQVLPTLLAAAPEERRHMLVDYVSAQVAVVLHVPTDKLDLEEPLNALGLDSLMAIELKNRIERELEIRIPIVTFLQGPSIAQFVDQLLEQVAVKSMSPEVVPPSHSLVENHRSSMLNLNATNAEQLLTQLDQLSDEEVDLLLGQMLSSEDGDGATNGTDRQTQDTPEDTVDSLPHSKLQKEEP